MQSGFEKLVGKIEIPQPQGTRRFESSKGLRAGGGARIWTMVRTRPLTAEKKGRGHLLFLRFQSSRRRGQPTKEGGPTKVRREVVLEQADNLTDQFFRRAKLN